MRHVTLTCKRHPELRWSCKSIAFSPGKGYNGCRSIFFNGMLSDLDKAISEIEAWSKAKPGDVLHLPTKSVEECDCSPADLILAPEEVEAQKTDPTYTPEGWDIY